MPRIAACSRERVICGARGSWRGDYGFTDADGTRPDWGRHDIVFDKGSGGLLDYIRTGCELQRDWLINVSRHTRNLLKHLPDG